MSEPVMTKFRIITKSYMDTSYFEVNHNGTKVLSPIDLNDDNEIVEFFKENPELDLLMGKKEYSYDEEEIWSLKSYYDFVKSEVKPQVTVPLVEDVVITENPVEIVTPPKYRDPVSENDRVITIVECEEGAAIVVNGEVVYMGNPSDFYSGCVGTKFDTVDVAGLWDTGIYSLANAMSVCYREQGHITITDVIELDDDLFWEIYL